MLRKIVTWIVVIPPLVVLVAFAVANRQAVTVSFDPFSSTAPAYAATLPLFAVLFVGVDPRRHRRAALPPGSARANGAAARAGSTPRSAPCSRKST